MCERFGRDLEWYGRLSAVRAAAVAPKGSKIPIFRDSAGGYLCIYIHTHTWSAVCPVDSAQLENNARIFAAECVIGSTFFEVFLTLSR